MLLEPFSIERDTCTFGSIRLLSMVMEKILQMFEKLWNYDVLALCVLMLCKSFSTFLLVVSLKLKLYVSSDLVTVFLYNCLDAGV